MSTVVNRPNFAEKLESTIGIYGTGLLDAITEDDLLAQYRKEELDGKLPNGLNPAFYAGGNWNSMYADSLQGDRRLKAFRRPEMLHWYLLIAVVSVLFTYFGANYLLPGLHSYA